MQEKYFNKTLLGALFLVVISGCAFSSGTISINYHPQTFPEYAYKGDGSKKLMIGTIADIRGQESNLLMHKMNGYGMKTSGAYLAEKPITDIMQDALRESLTSINYPIIKDGADLVLEGRLIKLDFEVLQGFITGTLKGSLIAEMSLRDPKTNNIVWRETVIGLGERNSGSMFAEDYITPAFKEVLDNFVKQLLSSPTFRQAFK